MKFSIIIPNWNGKKLLEKNLPAVIAAVDNQAELIVVDNGSTDGSVEFLKTLTKKGSLKAVYLERNYGFAYAVNLGVKKAKTKLVVLLNNDVVPEKGFLKPLEKDFKDPAVFAVSLNETQWSWAKGSWVKGFVDHKPGPKTKKTHLSFWASGGSGAFRKKIWDELGGFDLIYDPFYWEDVDLSYRAWKKGYKVLWNPNSIVDHQHEATISRFSKKYVKKISERNRLLFIWKNITDPKMILEHKFQLAFKLIKNPGYWRPFLAALVKSPQVLSKRLKQKEKSQLTDRQVFEKFS